MAAEQKYDGQVQIKAFARLQSLYPKLAFIATRTCDMQCILFNAVRTKSNELLSPILSTQKMYLDAPLDVKEVHEVLDSTFFKVVKHKQLSKSKHLIAIAALPERQITLVLKKSGKTSAETMINGSNSVLAAVHMAITFGAANIPNITHIDIIGIDKTTRSPTVERVTITSEMRARFDIKNLALAYATSR